MPPANHFDAAYYHKFYMDPKSRVTSQADVDRLGAFVCNYLKYLRLRVRCVLDIGCGLGYWRRVIRRHFPGATYTGVEYSPHLCRTKNWIQGSVVDFHSPRPFDLVVCQGVLQYLSTANARTAIANLADLCQGALYLEVLTRRDWLHVCDRGRTDGQTRMRSGAWYRRHLSASFHAVGGGVFLRKGAPVHLYELEKL